MAVNWSVPSEVKSTVPDFPPGRAWCCCHLIPTAPRLMLKLAEISKAPKSSRAIPAASPSPLQSSNPAEGHKTLGFPPVPPACLWLVGNQQPSIWARGTGSLQQLWQRALRAVSLSPSQYYNLSMHLPKVGFNPYWREKEKEGSKRAAGISFLLGTNSALR